MTTEIIQQLISNARKESSKFDGKISHSYLVGYYESVLNRLSQIPEVAELLKNYL